jgi:hypothetical protein
MTLSESPAAPGRRDGLFPRGDTCTPVLAAALSHLLRRDEEYPARWRTSSFAESVELARSELGLPATAQSLPVPAGYAGGDLGFKEAVSRLARNPGDVAVAIRRLELAERRSLPPWVTLVRQGLPSRPTDLDMALWFG